MKTGIGIRSGVEKADLAIARIEIREQDLTLGSWLGWQRVGCHSTGQAPVEEEWAFCTFPLPHST